MSPMFTAESLPVAWELYIPGGEAAGCPVVEEITIFKNDQYNDKQELLNHDKQ